MKIAWFTPFARASAIGRFSRAVTAELAKGNEVDIWHPQADDLHRTRLRTVAFSPRLQFEPDMLAPYDVLVYNLGDHLPFHRDIWLASQAAPGITILHDFVMHHFFAGYYLMDRKSRPEYLAAMVRLYGEAGREVTERAFAGVPPWVWETDRVVEFPFFEEAMRRAHGVVVHADFFRRKVEACFPGPVRKLALPYDCPSAAKSLSRHELGVPTGSLLLVTVGQVNPNKRIAAVLETLARDRDLCSRVVYAVVGACDGPYRETLAGLIREHGLQDAVRLPGHVPEDRLHAWLAHADICVNLRYPAMEGGSASLAEEMLSAKPVIVTDTGVYGELPDGCVVKVRPECEIEDLGAALRALATDPAARKTLGARARRFAEEEFRADKYAAGFLEFAAEVLEAKPLLQVADRMADRLAEMGVSPEAEIVGRVAEECYSLFCGKQEE